MPTGREWIDRVINMNVRNAQISFSNGRNLSVDVDNVTYDNSDDDFELRLRSPPYAELHATIKGSEIFERIISKMTDVRHISDCLDELRDTCPSLEYYDYEPMISDSKNIDSQMMSFDDLMNFAREQNDI